MPDIEPIDERYMIASKPGGSDHSGQDMII